MSECFLVFNVDEIFLGMMKSLITFLLLLFLQTKSTFAENNTASTTPFSARTSTPQPSDVKPSIPSTANPPISSTAAAQPSISPTLQPSIPEEVFCQPHQESIEVDPPQHRYVPYVTKMFRCRGFEYSVPYTSRHECRPVEQQKVMS